VARALVFASAVAAKFWLVPSKIWAV